MVVHACVQGTQDKVKKKLSEKLGADKIGDDVLLRSLL